MSDQRPYPPSFEQQPYPYPPYGPKKGVPTWVWVLAGCGCLFLVVIPLMLAAVLFPVFSQARLKAQQTSCLSNIKQMSLGVLMYAQDYDETMPRGREWMDVITPYIKNENVYHCPTVSMQNMSIYGYAFSSHVSGKKLETFMSPALTQMLYDSSSTARNVTDAVTSLPSPPRHSNGNNMGYVDGHAKWLRPGSGGSSGY